MQATETLTEGLKREFKVVVPAAELETKLSSELADLRGRVRINGFRPGKVPVAHLRRLYGQSVMADVVQNTINEANRKIVEENSLRLAGEPKVTLPEDKEEIDAIVAAKRDLAFSVALELLPSFEIKPLDGVTLEREVAEVPESAVDEAIERLAKEARPFNEKDGEAAAGDRVQIDFVGSIDGTPFEGGSSQDIRVEIGSGSFIPGFEEQLIGAKKGEERTVVTTFPEDYQAAHLAGKEASFAVTVKGIETPGEATIDDDFAKTVGFDSLDALKKVIRDSLERDFNAQSRRKVKKLLLDALDAQYDFDLPPSLVEQEFAGVWQQVIADLRQSGSSFEDEGTTEEASKEDYRKIAERRVRLGLVLAEVGDRAGVTVSEDEVTRGVVERARQFPGQEQAVWEFYSKNPQALAEIRAPIFEEKVVDHLLGQATVNDKTVTREELFADEDAEAEAAAAETPAEEPKAAKSRARKPKAAAADKETAESAEDAGAAEA
ncbi:trigger factor [Pseudochelatococcus contaminans]|uniref:Trigger factor n=1 Tax=Pseudochelatococcus contaminans TaxID=1538103 RepID=A0A7W6EEE0_9HYPH|nr:trigger factor [Pseudochelatococcus contaminans]MBB3808146.1 trigger factor [Pseudochelatococcus contaminans]